MFRRDGGFTLLETLAVMVIVGLLAAITVPQASKWREQAHLTSIKTDLKNAANAMEADHDGNVYPAAVPAHFKATAGNTVALGGSSGDGAEFYAPPGTRDQASITERGWMKATLTSNAFGEVDINIMCSRKWLSATTVGCPGPDGNTTVTYKMDYACEVPGSGVLTYGTATRTWSGLFNEVQPEGWAEPKGNARGSYRSVNPCTSPAVLQGARTYGDTFPSTAMGVLAGPAPVNDANSFCLNGASTKTTKKFSYSSVSGLKSGAC